MQGLNGREILETIEEIYEEIRNKRLFEKKLFSEIIAHLMGNDKYTEVEYILDTDHSLLLSGKNKYQEQVAIKVYLTHQSEYSQLYTLINQIKVQNHDQFFNNVHIHEIKTVPITNDVLVLYIEQEICGQSLLDIILQYKPKNIEIDQETKLQVVFKILDALNYLHKQNLPHNNLKFSNILQVSKSYKLSDHFLNIHDKLKKEKVIAQETDEESKNLELQRQIRNYQFKAPECNDNKEYSLQSDLYTLGFMLLQLDNVQKFNYNSIEELEKDYEKFFSQGMMPPTMQLQTDSIFYKNALNMIKKNPSERMNCEFYLQKFMLFLKEKKINMAIRVDSLDVDYERKIQVNSKILIQTIQSDKKLDMLHESLQELKYDEDDDQDLSHNFQEDIEEEEKDKFDDGNGIMLTIENNLTHPPNLQMIDQKQQQKKSSFYNIQIVGDENEFDHEKDQDKAFLNNKSPVIQSLNNSKLGSPTKIKSDGLRIPSSHRIDGPKSKFSTFQQINQSALQDENDIDDLQSDYSAHKQQQDTKSLEQNQGLPNQKSLKKQDDELSKTSIVESPLQTKSKKELPSQQKLSSHHIMTRERQNSEDIQRQFQENQKKLSQRKLLLQVQKSNVSQEVPSPVYANQSPFPREQKNDLILLSRIVQDKKAQQQSQLMQSGLQSGMQSGLQSIQRDETISQKVSQVFSTPEKQPPDQPIKPDEIVVEEPVVEMKEEKKEEQYQVQIKWCEVLDQSQKLISNPLQKLIDEVESQKYKLQSLQLDFTKFKILSGPTLLNLMNQIQLSSTQLKQLHLNISNNNQLRFSYINVFLERLAEQQARCFIVFRNVFNLVDLNLKIDTPAINGFLLRTLIKNQQGTLVRLNISLTQNIMITKNCADKIMYEVDKCSRLQQLALNIPADTNYEKNRRIKLKKIKFVSLISNQISYFRFTNNQNTSSIIQKLEDFNKDAYIQDVVKIRIMQNDFKLSSQSFSQLFDFISKLVHFIIFYHSQDINHNNLFQI